MQNCSLFILLIFIASFTGASLHAAEFGSNNHEHHDVECQVDECLFQPIISAVTVPDSSFISYASWVELSFTKPTLTPSTQSDYPPRAPPYFG